MRRKLALMATVSLAVFLAGCVGIGNLKSGGSVVVGSIKREHTYAGDYWKVTILNIGKKPVPVSLTWVEAFDSEGNKLAHSADRFEGYVTTCDDARKCTYTLPAGKGASGLFFRNLDGIDKIAVDVSWGDYEVTKGVFSVPYP